jgi:hypothetical protein
MIFIDASQERRKLSTLAPLPPIPVVAKGQEIQVACISVGTVGLQMVMVNMSLVFLHVNKKHVKSCKGKGRICAVVACFFTDQQEWPCHDCCEMQEIWRKVKGSYCLKS